MEKTEQAVRRTKDTWFRRLTRLFERASVDETLWTELEETLLGADVGATTTAQLLEKMRALRLPTPEQVRQALKEAMVRILAAPDGKPFAPPSVVPGTLWVIEMLGVNGVGKTTSIAKLAYRLHQEKRRVLLAAADTFRAAAIEQLQVWGQRCGAEVIAHRAGADPGAVVFDALEAARKRADVVIVDTAGRLHTKVNLMEELKKIKRVMAKVDAAFPHEVLLVLDATTGQNAIAQARGFTEATGVTGIFLAKLDGTARGGVVLAIAQELGLPIRFLGTGEGLEDLSAFDARGFVDLLFA